ncbi:MAG: dihydropteroate synthase [Myxococcota bacterium]
MASDSIFPRGRVTIVGVLNLTPDSFSDGGRFVTANEEVDVERALGAAEALLEAGSHVLDVGGESTRPGAAAVSQDREVARVLPVVEGLRKRFDAPISIDTRNAECARAALSAGAVAVNDVSGLQHDPDLARVVAEHDATLVLGHMRGTPETMQQYANYQDVRAEVARELGAAVERAQTAGVDRRQLVVDPGIGFSKGVQESLELLVASDWLKKQIGLPVLVGPSRKSFLGAVTGDGIDSRDQATWAACALAVFAGADAVRVHEPSGAVRATALGRAAREARGEAGGIR